MTVAAGTEVSFWDLTSWQCLKRFSLGVIAANGYGVNSASLHPNRKAFVAGGGNFWVYQHDFETGEELACNKGHHGPVYGATASRLSLAPSRLAGESPPPTHAWQTLPPPAGVRFTPDGKAYASAGDDGTIRFWNFASPEDGAGADTSTTAAAAAPES